MTISAERRKLIGAVHVAKKERGLDDETYRAMLKVHAGGKDSAKDCTDAELGKVLDHLNGKSKPAGPRRATSPVATKARALWISLHALGMISDPSERALSAWVKRQYQVDDLRFVRPADSFAVIEGLKQWAVRGGVDWTQYVDPRRCVLAAQWQILKAAGCAPALDLASLCYQVVKVASPAFCDSHQLDTMIRELWPRVRAVRGAE